MKRVYGDRGLELSDAHEDKGIDRRLVIAFAVAPDALQDR